MEPFHRQGAAEGGIPGKVDPPHAPDPLHIQELKGSQLFFQEAAQVGGFRGAHEPGGVESDGVAGALQCAFPQVLHFHGVTLLQEAVGDVRHEHLAGSARALTRDATCTASP